ncbi:hypothetical protein BDQ17DRAFT_1433383 [Cyathus striatus]|nr:hypothetical protein BDQ17DRAFT_1433383 [Cyathus striatus]
MASTSNSKVKSEQTTLTSIVANYHAKISGICAKTTDSVAQKETVEGFRPTRRKDQLDSGSSCSHTKSKNGAGIKKQKHTVIGSVMWIPCGLKNGQLVNDRVPSKWFMEKMRKYGLFVVKDRDGNEIEYKEGWSEEDIECWLRYLFPKIFEWLERHYGSHLEKCSWVLLQKDYQQMFILECEQLSGQDLMEAKGSKSKSSKDWCIRIASVKPIPPHVYEDFETALQDNIPLSEGSGSSSESDSPFPSPSPARQPQCKQRVATCKVTIDSDSTTSSPLTKHPKGFDPEYLEVALNSMMNKSSSNHVGINDNVINIFSEDKDASLDNKGKHTLQHGVKQPASPSAILGNPVLKKVKYGLSPAFQWDQASSDFDIMANTPKPITSESCPLSSAMVDGVATPPSMRATSSQSLLPNTLPETRDTIAHHAPLSSTGRAQLVHPIRYVSGFSDVLELSFDPWA